MEGFDASTYGDRFADVYDDWYADISDTDATVAAIAEMAGDGRILELGIGTGRLALPLHAAGVKIEGIDSSQAMIDLMVAKPGGTDIPVTLADMATLPLHGRFAGVFVAFNTFFNLASAQAQEECLARVAQLLEPGGWFAIEAFVPSEEPEHAETRVDTRDMTVDKIVLTITKRDPADQTIVGHHVEISEAGGIKMRPSVLRYLRPHQLDQMATAAGLTLFDRWADWQRTPFDEYSAHHVSIYRSS